MRRRQRARCRSSRAVAVTSLSLAGVLALAAAPARAAAPAVAPAPAAAPAPNRPIVRRFALYVSACPSVAEPAVRRIVAVEIGEALVDAGQPAPPDGDRVLISCKGDVATLEAAPVDGPGGTRRALVRTLALGGFPGEAGARALALAAVEMVTALGRQREPASGANVDAYQQRFVWFYDSVTVVYGGFGGFGAWFGRTWIPYQGRYRQPLEGGDFYRAVERPDLASRYARRQATRIGLVVAGVGAEVYGFTQFRSHSSAAGYAVLGGLVAIFVSWIIDADPVNEPEARQIADVYNKALKSRLGLASLPRPTTPTPDAEAARAKADRREDGPWAAPRGAALALEIQF